MAYFCNDGVDEDDDDDDNSIALFWWPWTQWNNRQV